MKKETKKFVIFAAFVAVMVFLGYYFDIDERFSIEKIQNFIITLGLWAPVVYIGMYMLTSIIFFPASLLSTASGAIWGVYLGTVYTVIGAVLASIIPFIIARHLGRGFAAKMTEKNTAGVCDRFISKNGFFSILFARLIPLFPWDVVNYGAGMCGIRFRDYLFATALGIIPGSFTYNLIGSTLGQPLDITKVVIVTAVVVLMGTVTFLIKKKNGGIETIPPK
ncbi:MAG: TVP38/TMEM64 family protein [Waddliaceae bacterium]|jgi:uncharacterized membrane protein YdjX (TVP38/TMEM64 family)|nr:TVP38/TMEM64 family protein [Waddliaceae bacterium]MBT3578765.1 TVP38/TMEM64 family protein [Waddliaceae bacterium]MBT6927875.1 TVP38/TMEM64 family protein [Waddliaceae bacterium]MBT7265223.1 TVP38/TMEM64 family protein [Waddliaceae bacterium]MBT7461765.1 TVP38/TMEM64 family protein [Waddliaceae bacterium]